MQKWEIIVQGAIDRLGCGYVYGGTGAYCTVAYREARAKQYPEYVAKIKANCMRMSGRCATCIGIDARTRKPCPWWDKLTNRGKKLYDCAQLTKACAKLAGIIMPSGATSQWQALIWIQKSTIDTLPADCAGIFLFWSDGKGRMKHTAVYIGGGELIEARGHDYGVVRSTVSGRKPTHWARLKDLEPGEKQPNPPEITQPPITPTVQDKRPTLRKGANGLYVATLQALLMAKGFTAKGFSDKDKGIFGPKTLFMVRTFQGVRGLVVDGIVGPITWAALLAPDSTEEREV